MNMEQDLPQPRPGTPNPRSVTRAADKDVELAQLLFSRALTTDQIGKEVGLDGGQVRRISRGESRKQVKELVDELYRDCMDADKQRLVQERFKALKVLADGMKSDSEAVKIQSAIALRRELAGVGISIGDVDGSVVFIDAAQAAIIFKRGRKDEVPTIIEQGEGEEG